MISFSLAALIGEADIFGVAGIIRYSWIMWLFIPVGVLSILIGMELKKIVRIIKKFHYCFRLFAINYYFWFIQIYFR